MFETSGGSVGVTRFLYDGDALVAEYDGSNNLLHRYVHGPGVDEPIVWYFGASVGAATKRFLVADERGSSVAVTDAAGTILRHNRYDEYGVPAPENLGRFQYTGQAWIPELGMYYYKARIYSPILGRFLQTDPIGYGAGMNLYAYVTNDPVNFIDPTGLREICWSVDDTQGQGSDITIQSKKVCQDIPDFAFSYVGGPINWNGEASSSTTDTTADGTRVCGPIPPAPPGININKIIDYAKGLDDKLNVINILGFVYNNFRNSAGMDFKQIKAQPGSQSPFEDFGNFAFGAFTYEAGLSPSLALGGAGIAQIASGNAKANDVFSNFDDPNDQEQIKEGRQYASCQLR